MIRWGYFQNQGYLSVSLLLSSLLHFVIFCLLVSPRFFISNMIRDSLHEHQKEHSLIRLRSVKNEQEDKLDCFVSTVRRQSTGKLTKSPPKINIPGQGDPTVMPGISSSVKDKSSLDLLKIVQKKSPEYMGSILEEARNTKDHSNDSVYTEYPSEGGEALSQNSKKYQFATTEEGSPQIGGNQHEWAEFYLSYADACSQSLRNLFRLVPLVGTDQIVFITRVFDDGSIRFIEYLQQSPKYPILNDIGKQMIKFSKKLEKIPPWNFFLQKNFVQVVVKLAYSQQTGIWTISFYGETQ